ncbi:hypothetical protein Tco_0912320 [Tanacetum coccineum]
MGDVNPIRTLGDYSKPIHEGYRNTIKLPVGNNVALIDFDSHQEKRLSSLMTQLGQHQDDMISKKNLLGKAVFENLDDAPIHDTAGNPAAQMNFTSTNNLTREELQGKGIKNETKEEGNVKTITTECEDHEMTVESKEEFREETEDEIKEEEEDCLKHFNTFPTMKELRLHYNWIMSNRLEPRRKLSNPKKNYNFVGRVRGLKVFIGNFTYECDFMVLKDTTNVIDHYLGLLVFGKPFMDATELVYNKEEGMVVFERDKERIIFKTPHKMDMFKHIDFADRGTDSIPLFIIESDDDDCEKTHYSDNLDLGPEYKYNEYVCRGIQSLMAAKARRRSEGEVT